MPEVIHKGTKVVMTDLLGVERRGVIGYSSPDIRRCVIVFDHDGTRPAGDTVTLRYDEVLQRFKDGTLKVVR